MEIPKPSEADKERFRQLVPDAPGVEVKPMFGNLAGFVNGNMFMGLFGPLVGVRLPDEARQELLAEDGAGPFGPPERPMGEYASLPPDWDDEMVAPWIERSLAHVGQFPPKAKKPKKATAKKAASKKRT